MSTPKPDRDTLEIDMTDYTPLAPEDVRIADDRLDKFVWEVDDVVITRPDFLLTITDGEQIVLVQTRAQLLVWCEAQGITLDEFMRDFPIAKKMPQHLREQIEA